MSTKSPECWANDPQARGVRVEISAEHSMLLPHDEFAFAELKSEGKEQQLRLVFAMHEVLVRGHSLRRIQTASRWFSKSSLLRPRHKKRRLQTAHVEQTAALHNSSKKLRICAWRRKT